MAENPFLAALQDPLYTSGETYSGIGAGAVAGALPALVDPYASTGSNALNVMGGSILAALLGNMAKNDAAEENAQIATQQALFLNSDPNQQLKMVQENPRVFSRLQAALNTQNMATMAEEKALQRQFEIKEPYAINAENRALKNQVDLTTNPEIRAAQIADSINKKRGEKLGELQANSLIFGNNPLANPDSPEYKISQAVMKEEDAARSELAKLPSVVSFNNAASGLAKIKSLKDLDTSTSDIPFIYAFVQGMDGGVVKEGEVALVESSNPVLKKYSALLEKALNGQSSLTTDVKKQMYNELVNAQASVYNQALFDSKNRLDIVGQRGGDPLRATAIPTDLFFGQQSAAQTPLGGTDAEVDPQAQMIAEAKALLAQGVPAAEVSKALRTKYNNGVPRG